MSNWRGGDVRRDSKYARVKPGAARAAAEDEANTEGAEEVELSTDADEDIPADADILSCCDSFDGAGGVRHETGRGRKSRPPGSSICFSITSMRPRSFGVGTQLMTMDTTMTS